MKKIPLSIILVLLNLTLFSQKEVELVKYFGSDSTSKKPVNFIGEKIKKLDNRSYLIMYDSSIYVESSNHHHIQKIDSSGKVIWSLEFLHNRIHDILIDSNYFYLTGSKFYTNKIWLAKYDFNGKVIWTNQYKFNFDAEPYRIASSKNGDFYILGLIRKEISLPQINFKNGIRNWVRFLRKGNRPKKEKIVLLSIDKRGEKKWEKFIGKWENFGLYYRPSSIAVNNLDEICFTANISVNCSGCTNDGIDSWIVKLNNKKKIVAHHFLKSAYLYKIISDHRNSFNIVGLSSSRHQFKFDSLYIYSLGSSNNLSLTHGSESKFYTISISNAKFDESINSFFVSGHAHVNQIRKAGAKWIYNHDNWLARISINSNKFSEWTTKKNQKERITDFELTDKHIITIGDSWNKPRKKRKGYKQLSLMWITK